MTQSQVQFYVNVMGEVSGPYTSAQVRELAEHGKLLTDSFVRKGTDGKWISADRVQGLRFSRQQDTPTPQLESALVTPNNTGNTPVLLYAILRLGLLATVAGALWFIGSLNLGRRQASQSDAPVSDMQPLVATQSPSQTESPEVQSRPFAFVTDREKMIGFAFARLENARYTNNQGAPVSFDEMSFYTIGVHHLKRRTAKGFEIQSRLSRDPDGQNFIYLQTEGSAATMDHALDAALEFEDVYTWIDATKPAMEAFNQLETVRKTNESMGFKQSRSKTHQTQVGNGIGTWYIQINEQSEPDSHGLPWARILLQWDWKPKMVK